MPTLVKVRKSGYTKVSNICFFDKRLSFKDVGLYCSMLSLPDNWEWSLNGLQQLHTDGKDSIRTSVNNLLKYGYISRQQTKDDRGKYSHIQYFIYDDPQDNPEFCMDEVEDPGEKTPWLENPTADDEGGLEPWLENPITGENEQDSDPEKWKSENPTSEKWDAEKQPQYIKYEYNTYPINNIKINEEEDISHEGVDLSCFKRKLTNSYLCARLMKQDDSKEAVEMDKALNAVLNAVREIGDPKTIEAINHCSSEEAGNLWYRIYREMFSTDLGGIIRNNVADKRAYIRKLISNELTLSSGGENLTSIVMSAGGGI